MLKFVQCVETSSPQAEILLRMCVVMSTTDHFVYKNIFFG